VHPALLDAALHVLVYDAAQTRDGLLLPFSWSGMRLAGTAADTLRIALSRPADGDATLVIADGDGRPLGGVAALTLRPARAVGGIAAGSGGLERLDWVATPLAPADAAGRTWAVVGTDPQAEAVADAVRGDGIGATLCYELASVAELGTPPQVVLLPYLPDPRIAAEDPPYVVHEGLSELLDTVQQWVTGERVGDQLVVLADPDAVVSAPVWGLLRSAAAEHPGRFTLANVTGGAAGTWRLLAAALDAGEPQCTVRDGAVLVPRVAAAPAADGAAPDLTAGTVLVTGGTGGLGALVASHLVERHGVRDLLLTSRRGSAAAGAAELTADLERRGATVRIAACDVADRSAMTALLNSVPGDRPLVGVLHAAGVLDDGTIEGLSPDRLDAVLRPKVDAGWLLHELTADLPLSAFVLFSSAAGVLGTLGQASYAAANAFLDALARHRASLGRPGVSIGWGLWSLPTGMTAGLSAADRDRLAGTGLAEMPSDQGLALLDAALAATGPVLAARWDLAGVRAQAQAGGDIPAVLRGMVRQPRPTPAPAAAGQAPALKAQQAPAADGLAAQLAGLGRASAAAAVQDLVQMQVAAALGHDSVAAIDLDTPFTELGIDSLTGVELRNRLSKQTGLRLPATLVFNEPTVTGLSRYLLRELVPTSLPPDQVLQQALAQVAEHLNGADAQPQERDQVMVVLQKAMAQFGGPGDDGDPLASLGLNSDEEMLDFIDNQL
jgi:acyl carrier protein